MEPSWASVSVAENGMVGWRSRDAAIFGQWLYECNSIDLVNREELWTGME
jgi:hypothetical protein